MTQVYERKRRMKPTCQQPPQKLRCLSGYNCFTSEFLKSEEGKQIQTLSEKNKEIGRRWRALSNDEKEKYGSIALEESTSSKKGSWTNVSKLLKNLNENCQYAEVNSTEMFYVVAYGTNHYCSGTNGGIEFLNQNPKIVSDFLYSQRESSAIHLKGKSSSRAEWERNRKLVQNLLNMKYALAAGDPKARVPYASLSQHNVKNFPSELKFGHPSTFGNDALCRILDCAEEIQFDLSVSIIHYEHSYSKRNFKGGHRPRKSTTKKTSSQTELTYCHNDDSYEQMLVSLTTCHTSETESGLQKNSDVVIKEVGRKKVFPNKKVCLLDETNAVVAKATTMSGNVMHGDSLPPDFTKVAINEVFNSKASLHYHSYLDNNSSSDNLLPGMITAWKNNYIVPDGKTTVMPTD